MGSCISAIGTANPKNKIPQQTIYHFMANAFGLDNINAARLKHIYEGSGIDNRYSVIPDFAFSDTAEYTFFGNSANLEPFPTTQQRLKLYQQCAIDIATQAARQCFDSFDSDVAPQITHLITVSCTGMYAPGIDIDLVTTLGLNRQTERTCINFMGCYGAINALKAADYICRADAGAKVLVVSIELCTLHFQKNNTLDNWVANSLFSDGAAAVLVENELQKIKPGKALLLRNFYSEFMPEASDDMGWYVGNLGFEMKLTSKVSKHIKKHIKALTGRVLQKAGLSFEQIDEFAIHPGGKSILEATEEALDISAAANHLAYQTLREYGNMSSATILFVLQKILRADTEAGKNILSFAFGPGLTVEGMILETGE
ncbi:putative naringenin-chalcone synthase [Mucilaginibacter gracilis]|uniref:Putative naringenin-chalcone synthase n=1 Tax=Mucilaginibacter gracilis TaxID=423350 RepID=A0A495IV74_9SPHI|nr:type III polyketide synthase [Mucilaginibacter gracilis]RKR80657.1 putative naringenin-chalcone synthase [Mucilaginibacter gracilis]